jgi:CDP-diacylglycerol---glycerol-3-phosphate 3-phosphatidyltransferase
VPTIYDLKPQFQALLRPVCRRLANAEVTANQVTLAAIALSLLHGTWIALEPTSRLALLLLPLTLIVRLALNAIDGVLAREFGMKSEVGAVLNELGDVASDVALYLPFALVPGLEAPLIVLFVVAALSAEIAGVLGDAVGGMRRHDGPLGKSDRAAAMGLLAVLLGVGVEPGPWSRVALAMLLALSVLTVINRAHAALRRPAGDRS